MRLSNKGGYNQVSNREKNFTTTDDIYLETRQRNSTINYTKKQWGDSSKNETKYQSVKELDILAMDKIPDENMGSEGSQNFNPTQNVRISETYFNIDSFKNDNSPIDQYN